MEAIAFAVLGTAACAFLVCVFVNFGRELRLLRQTRSASSHLIPLGPQEEPAEEYTTRGETRALLGHARTHSASA